MSENWIGRIKISPTPPRLSNWLVTILIFSVFGVFSDAFLSNFTIFWQSCTAAFPGSNWINLVQLIFGSATSATISDFPKYFVWPSYHLGGIAAIVSGTKLGKPSFIFVVLAFVIATAAFSLFANNFAVLIALGVFTLRTAPVASILVVPLCWLISKFFWK